MRKHSFIYVAAALASLYWVVDSTIHWLVFDQTFTLLPHDPNEIWMRSLIILLLLGFGVYADYGTTQLRKKEEEKRRVFKATVHSTQHILNNLLNNLMLFKIEMDENDIFSDDVRQLFNETLESSAKRVQRLSEVHELTEEKIKQSVFP